MGEYIYKVTAKKKTLSDGTMANIAEFAYKPTFSWDMRSGKSAGEINRGWAWKSGCHIAERYVTTSKNYTGRVVLGEEGTVAVPVNRGSFSDGWFDMQIEKIMENV